MGNPDPREFLEDAIATHGRRVWALAFRVTGDAHETEDVFQEVFLRIWRTREAFPRLARPDAWVYRVTLNAALDAREKSRRLSTRETHAMDATQAAGAAGAPDAAASESEMRTILRRHVDGLPRAQREVFVLRNDEGLPYRRIAEILDCPEERARANFYQAMKSLRTRMREAVQ